jgi:hypothetical protein
MSLGGYKFAGKYCEKGSLTDQQWALLMHKTKVAAFMAANALSGAGWDYDMTGSPDGNYHCLDSVGNNYVTVFKRTNGTDDYTWFAIYTLTLFTWSGTDSGAIKLYIYENYYQMYYGYYATNFYRIGTSAISYSDTLDVAPTSRVNIIGPMPVGNVGANSSGISSSYYPPSNTSLKDVTLASFGYAIKGDSIIMLQGHGSAFLSSYLKCSVASGHGFSSFVDSSDSCGAFAYNTQIENNNSSGYENAERNVNYVYMSSALCAATNHTNVGGAPKYVAKLGAIPLATYSSSPQEYPFQSIMVFGITNDGAKPSGKGALNIDMIAVNFPGANQGIVPSLYSTVANGNYLCVNSVTGTYYFKIKPLNTSDDISWNAAMYVGWDPSNPDITQASAWTEYEGT